MKNIVKCYKDFFGYFNALKTHCVLVCFRENRSAPICLWFYLTFTYPLLASALAFLYCYKGKSAYCWHFHYVVRTTYLPRLVKEVCERPLILFTFPFIARRLIDILSAQYSIEFHSMHFWQPSITPILKIHEFPFRERTSINDVRRFLNPPPPSP